MSACRRFEEALARGPEAVATVEAHARRCEDCRARLQLWEEISAAAPSLRKNWESPELPARIVSAVNAASQKQPAAPPAPRRRLTWVPAAAAAALFALSMIGLYVFKPGEAARDPLSNLRAARQPLLTDSTLSDVETAESKYLQSIEKLSRVARPRLEKAETPLLVAYREKLELLDSAIVEVRGQIERNRYNTHLRRELLAMYQEKQRTLQDVMKEVPS
jgi:hypothetical protein